MTQRRLLRQNWEGIYAADFTLDGVRRRCLHMADALIANRWSCLVAHDTRFMAGQFARYVYRLLEARGVHVSFCPTPAPFPSVELALDQRKADTALLISAGNRPFWFSGMIALTPPLDQPLLGEPGAETAAGGHSILFPPPALDDATQPPIDLRAPYLESLRTAADVDLIRRTTLTVFVDPMNGTTSGCVPAAIGEGGQTKAIEINRETDPLFGRQVPLPSEAGLNRLRKLVRESDSHLGVALSADGRALSVVDSAGEAVLPNDLALLLADYLNGQYRQRGAIIAPFSADSAASDTATAGGLRMEHSADAGARIAEVLANDRNGLLVGVTPGGEVTLGRYSSSPDATLVALLLLELIARKGGRLRDLVEEAKKKP